MNISKGKVLPGSGLAEFRVKYQAIVFKPYRGEVLDAVISTVNKVSSTGSIAKVEFLNGWV